MKCASELGYHTVAGLDLDEYLLGIARRNMARLKLNADCIQANAVEFDGYAAYDVFYFYNPFGKNVFQQVIQKLLESQYKRNREIWVVYYHPVYGELFQQAGFRLADEKKDRTRDTVARYYHLPRKEDTLL